MSTVRAKFKVDSITKRKHWDKSKPDLSDIALSPVVSSDPNSENSKFYAATPGGEIKLSTINSDAAAAFELGEEYYIDFTKAN
jgi:hypothetical protein